MQPNTIDLTKILKVGDKVYSDKRGEGIVTRNEPHEHSFFPLTILYESSVTRRSYTATGYSDGTCIMHELYPSSALEPWQEPMQEGELVYCSDDCKWWIIANYTGKDDNGGFIVKSGIYSKSFRAIRKFSECPLPPKIDVK